MYTLLSHFRKTFYIKYQHTKFCNELHRTNVSNPFNSWIYKVIMHQSIEFKVCLDLEIYKWKKKLVINILKFASFLKQSKAIVSFPHLFGNRNSTWTWSYLTFGIIQALGFCFNHAIIFFFPFLTSFQEVIFSKLPYPLQIIIKQYQRTYRRTSILKKKRKKKNKYRKNNWLKHSPNIRQEVNYYSFFSKFVCASKF